MPQWYLDVHAARFAGVPLPEWHAMPLLWRNHYLGAMSAEAGAQRELARFVEALKKNKESPEH